MKYQKKSIGNPVTFNRNFNEIPIEIHWKSSWTSKEISMKYQLKSIGNPAKIQKKFQWNINGIPLEIQLKL